MWFKKLGIFNDGLLERQWNALVRFFVNPRFGTDTDYTEFEVDGTLKANGAATTWNDINFNGANLRPGPSAPAWSNVIGDLYGWVFSATAIDELHGCEEILHDYKEGSDISVHVHWIPQSIDTGVCRWGLEYTWCNIGGTLAAPTTIYVEQAAAGTNKYQTVSFPNISGTGKNMASVFCCRIFRDGTHINDTFTGGAFMPQFGIHYERDTLGSRSMTTK